MCHGKPCFYHSRRYCMGRGKRVLGATEHASDTSAYDEKWTLRIGGRPQLDTRSSTHIRSISRSPAYAITCIAVIALGVGANAAIFSMVHSVILTPLPYPDSDRLVFVWEKLPNMPDPLGSRIQAARKNYLEWKRQNQSFAGMAAFQEEQLNETSVGAGASHFRRLGLSGLLSDARSTSAARTSLPCRGRTPELRPRRDCDG